MNNRDRIFDCLADCYSFLPHTASYDNKGKEDVPPQPSPDAVHKRSISGPGLTSRLSSLSLYGGVVNLSPYADPEDASPFFTPDSRRSSNMHPGDPRTLLHSDADVPEWGTSVHLYNQPRSRAGPLPSRSVTDFRKLHDGAVSEARAVRETEQGKASSSDSATYDNFIIEPAIRGNGALLHAMRAVQSESEKKLDIAWVGTLGHPTDALDEDTKTQIREKLTNDFDEEVVYMTDQDFAGHYTNFCKVVLWPLFHYQVPDDVNSKAYTDRSFHFYYNVNRAFADHLIESCKHDDTIWVHDYHLLLVPSMVREKRPHAKIGFFLHTAFPSSEIFRCQEKYKDLLNGMLGANLVVFQLPEYADHFLSTCSRFLSVEAMEKGVQLDDRFVRVTSQPIGINPADIDEVRQTEAFAEAVASYKKQYEGKKIIVGRDKLDRVYGLKQKFQAFEKFLDQFPHHAKDTIFLQIISQNNEPNKEYTHRVIEIVNRINDKHSSFAKQQLPIVLIGHQVGPAEYYALLTVGDVLMISTQRDGMNLTAHEFLYCQDGKVEDRVHGAVILSEFAGCAEILKGNQLTINPWNIRQQVAAIASALNMDSNAKEAQWTPQYEMVTSLTGKHWYQQLSQALAKAHKVQTERSAASVPRLQFSDVSEAYDRAKHRLFFLDYEGTLAPRQSIAGAHLASPQRAIDVLNDLMMDPKNVVYVTSRSLREQLAHTFQTADDVGLIAADGCYKSPHRKAGQREWTAGVDEFQTVIWKEQVTKILSHFRTLLEGSTITEKDCSIEFELAGVKDKKILERLSRECADQINGSCKTMGVRAVLIGETVIIEQTVCNKNTMADKVLRDLKHECAATGFASPDFLMVAGDDREDEVLFHWANKLSKLGMIPDVFSISIGNRDTEAKAAMSKGSAGLLSALEKLASTSLKDLPIKNPATKRSLRFELPKA